MSPDLIKIWGESHQRVYVYQTKVNDVDELKQRVISSQAAWEASSTKELLSDANAAVRVFAQKHNIFSIY